jgi:hypothetical protein
MFTLEQPMKAQMGVEVWLYCFCNLNAEAWVVKAMSRGCSPWETDQVHIA